MVTDQDKIPRFANGDPVHPLGKPEPPWRTLGVIFGTWALVIAVLIGAFWLMFALVAERRAHADETAARIFEVDGECYIDTDLRVTGNKRAACVDKLDTATRLARATMLVNEGRRKKP
jgi:hypothetical protein